MKISDDFEVLVSKTQETALAFPFSRSSALRTNRAPYVLMPEITTAA